MKRSLIALAVTVTLTAGVAAVHAATVTYSDVNGNWAQADINAMTQMNVMTGFSDNQFHPDAWVSRSEFGTMTSRVLGLPSSQISQLPSVQNVSQNSWQFGIIDNQAWISAYPQGVYRPENPVRRAEVFAALAGTLNKPLVSEAEANQILQKYSDASQIPANLRIPVATAIKYDLVTNNPQSGDLLNPLQPATRADVAVALNNLYDERDIAIVQNGRVITPAPGVAVGLNAGTNLGISSSQTSQVRGYESQTDMSTGTSTSSEASSTTTSTFTTAAAPDTTSTTTGTTTASATEVPTGSDEPQAYKLNTSGDDTWLRSKTPYRNSADTVEASRFGSPVANQEQITSATLPINTTFTGTVAKALFSEYNRPGDPVVVILDHALTGPDGRVIAPAGSRVLGQVSYVLPSNTSGDPAQLGIAFNEINTPAGQRILISGRVNNTDGILKADAMQGVVIHPQHSVSALKREISTAQGALYGTKQGKMQVLETPLTTLGSAQPVTGLSERITPNIIIGVGDKLQVRIDGNVPAPATPSTTQ